MIFTIIVVRIYITNVYMQLMFYLLMPSQIFILYSYCEEVLYGPTF